MNRLLFFASNAPNAHKGFLKMGFPAANRRAIGASIDVARNARRAFFGASRATHSRRFFACVLDSSEALRAVDFEPIKSVATRRSKFAKTSEITPVVAPREALAGAPRACSDSLAAAVERARDRVRLDRRQSRTSRRENLQCID